MSGSGKRTTARNAPVATLYGFHGVITMLRRAPERCVRVWLASERDDARAREVLALAADVGVRVEREPQKQLDARAGDGVHQGVVLEFTQRAEPDESELYDDVEAHIADFEHARRPQAPLLLVLDEVTDPRNFGALLRVADGAGADAIVTTRRNSAPLTPVVHKSSAGAAAEATIYRVTNLARALGTLRDLGVCVVGLDDRASQEWHGADLRGPIALVLGAEGVGMRRLTREHCDVLLRLPMAGVASSLNVSVAAGIALYEARRQRGALVSAPPSSR